MPLMCFIYKDLVRSLTLVQLSTKDNIVHDMANMITVQPSCKHSSTAERAAQILPLAKLSWRNCPIKSIISLLKTFSVRSG